MTALAPISGRGGASFVLPVSGITVALRPPSGWEELVLLETSDDDLAALALAEELAEAEDDDQIIWAELTPTDLDAFVLRLRQVRLGNRILSHVACRAEGCGTRTDISFGIEGYLNFHRPQSPRHPPASLSAEPGWFTLVGHEEIRFRLPTVADLILARRKSDPPAALARARLQPSRPPARWRRRLEQAMAAMAPPLSSELEGTCPECGATIRVAFKPRAYCLQELRDRARYLYEDVDLLASRYRWSEESILAIPTRRRQTYVELALSQTA